MSNAAISLPYRGMDPVREERVEAIMALGASGEWRRRGSRAMCAELGLRWGVQPNTVRTWACESWRRLQRETVDDHDLIASRLLAGVEGVFNDSIAEGKAPVLIAGKEVYEESPSVPRKVALEAAKTLAELLRQNTSLAQLGGPEWQAMSVPQRRELLDRARAKFAELEADTDALEARQMGMGEP